MSFYRRHGKRALDIVLACAAIMVLSPILAALALAIWMVDGRPIFFHQLRPGFGGRPFRLRKFRSMANRTDDQGRPLPDRERLTGLGRFLRRWSLDELPELVNVVGGEMSLVGPRPLLMSYLDRYSLEQARRHEVLPGITGWAQVQGRNAVTWEEKFELDVWYVDHLSLRLDLSILARTAGQVLTGRGISAPGHATMPEFDPREE